MAGKCPTAQQECVWSLEVAQSISRVPLTLFQSCQALIKTFKRQHSSMATEPHYPIQGVAVPSGQPLPSRMNFNDWSANYEQSISVSLFIRALQRWYSMDYSNMLSYFRTAGESPPYHESCCHYYVGNAKSLQRSMAILVNWVGTGCPMTAYSAPTALSPSQPGIVLICSYLRYDLMIRGVDAIVTHPCFSNASLN